MSEHTQACQEAMQALAGQAYVVERLSLAALEDAISDTISNLLHLAVARGLEPDLVLRRVRETLRLELPRIGEERP